MVAGLEHRGVDGGAVAGPEEMTGGGEDERVGVAVGTLPGSEHEAVEFEGRRIIRPGGGEATDHDVEGEGVGIGDAIEVLGSVVAVAELDEFEEETVLPESMRSREHAGVELLQGPDTGASSEQGENKNYRIPLIAQLAHHSEKSPGTSPT